MGLRAQTKSHRALSNTMPQNKWYCQFQIISFWVEISKLTTLCYNRNLDDFYLTFPYEVRYNYRKNGWQQSFRAFTACQIKASVRRKRW